MSGLRRKASFLCATFITVGLLWSSGEAVAQTETHERAIADAYASWVKSVNDKDLEVWASFLADDAVFLPPDSPVLSDRQQILDRYAEELADPLFAFDCIEERVDVAASEDMAWSTGHCKSSFTGADGKLAHGTSKWLKVWKRQADGEWKCVANSWSPTGAD